jgi:hypothetical protein
MSYLGDVFLVRNLKVLFLFKNRIILMKGNKMGFAQGHKLMKPLLDAAKEFYIASNPAPVALFEAGSAGFQIWCTPDDHPGGLWSQVKMIAGAFSKPCEFVADVGWEWSKEENPNIIGIELTTIAYALHDARLLDQKSMANRPDDIAWAKQKIEWLWQASRATDKMPPIKVANK